MMVSDIPSVVHPVVSSMGDNLSSRRDILIILALSEPQGFLLVNPCHVVPETVSTCGHVRLHDVLWEGLCRGLPPGLPLFWQPRPIENREHADVHSLDHTARHSVDLVLEPLQFRVPVQVEARDEVKGQGPVLVEVPVEFVVADGVELRPPDLPGRLRGVEVLPKDVRVVPRGVVVEAGLRVRRPPEDSAVVLPAEPVGGRRQAGVVDRPPPPVRGLVVVVDLVPLPAVLEAVVGHLVPVPRPPLVLVAQDAGVRGRVVHDAVVPLPVRVDHPRPVLLPADPVLADRGDEEVRERLVELVVDAFRAREPPADEPVVHHEVRAVVADAARETDPVLPGLRGLDHGPVQLDRVLLRAVHVLRGLDQVVVDQHLLPLEQAEGPGEEPRVLPGLADHAPLHVADVLAPQPLQVTPAPLRPYEEPAEDPRDLLRVPPGAGVLAGREAVVVILAGAVPGRLPLVQQRVLLDPLQVQLHLALEVEGVHVAADRAGVLALEAVDDPREHDEDDRAPVLLLEGERQAHRRLHRVFLAAPILRL
mmetsp:Transcript_30546/g.74395  ORF Transcript_30546/g.74395 Transcript_30546/m.74395 type:complete len:534 (-) Transcript_30546:150-1751(-)